MQTLNYTPAGVCAQHIEVELDGEIVRRVVFTGGCQGNVAGVSRLVVGMTRAEVLERLSGIDCKGRGTSCPDQLCEALNTAK